MCLSTHVSLVDFSLLALIFNVRQELLHLLLITTNSAVCSGTLPGEKKEVDHQHSRARAHTHTPGGHIQLLFKTVDPTLHG